MELYYKLLKQTSFNQAKPLPNQQAICTTIFWECLLCCWSFINERYDLKARHIIQPTIPVPVRVRETEAAATTEQTIYTGPFRPGFV